MSAANETIADIAEDIRMQNQGLPEDSNALSPLVCDLLNLADRIEAAAKGNAAAMREAIKKLLDVMYMLGMDENTVAIAAKGGALPKTSKRLLDAIQSAKAAIAAPARNCDAGTAEEQEVRYWRYFLRSEEPMACPTVISGALKWAQMPYEEGGAK